MHDEQYRDPIQAYFMLVDTMAYRLTMGQRLMEEEALAYQQCLRVIQAQGRILELGLNDAISERDTEPGASPDESLEGDEPPDSTA